MLNDTGELAVEALDFALQVGEPPIGSGFQHARRRFHIPNDKWIQHIAVIAPDAFAKRLRMIKNERLLIAAFIGAPEKRLAQGCCSTLAWHSPQAIIPASPGSGAPIA